MKNKYSIFTTSFLCLGILAPLSVSAQQATENQAEVEKVYSYADGTKAVVSKDNTTLEDKNASYSFHNNNQGQVKKTEIKGRYRIDSFVNLKNVLENSLNENDKLNNMHIEMYDNEKNTLLYTYDLTFLANQQEAEPRSFKVYDSQGNKIAESNGKNRTVYDAQAFEKFQKVLKGEEINTKSAIVKEKANNLLSELSMVAMVIYADKISGKNIPHTNEEIKKLINAENFTCGVKVSTKEGDIFDLDFPEKCLETSAEEKEFDITGKDVIEAMHKEIKSSNLVKLSCTGNHCQMQWKWK